MLFACILLPDYVHNTVQRHTQKFPTSQEGLTLLGHWLRHTLPADFRQFVIESTSTYHFPVVLALTDFTPIIINPMLVGAAKRKADKWDAASLAYHCLTGVWPPQLLPTSEEFELRLLLRRRRKILASTTQITNSLGSRLTAYGVTISRLFPMKSKLGLDLVTALVQRRPLVSFARTEEESRELEALQPLADMVPTRIRNMLDRMVQDVVALEEEKAFVEKEALDLAAMVHQEKGIDFLGLLKTVPGIGPICGLTFLAEVGFHPARRFATCRKAVAYCGFDPTKRYSADKVTSHLTRSGNKHVRVAFIQAAQGVLTRPGELAAWGRSVGGRNKGNAYNTAVLAVARRLCRACYYVLNLQQPFDPSHWNYHAQAEQLDRELRQVLQKAQDLAGRKLNQAQKGQVLKLNSALAEVAGIRGWEYVIAPTAVDGPLANLPDGIKHLLASAGVTSRSGLWCWLQTHDPSSVKGLGPKRHAKLVAWLEQEGFLLRGKPHE
jgi:transposase